MFESRRKNVSYDIKHENTVSIMKSIHSEYCDITSPFSFDFKDGSELFRIHVFIVCGNIFSLKRNSTNRTEENCFDGIDIGEKNKKFPFHAYLFAERIGKKDHLFKAPFFIGVYLFDYDCIFNSSGHINNNENIKDNFIKILKENVVIDINKKLPIMFISGNDFSCYLANQKKITKELVLYFSYSSFHNKINDGFNVFYSCITLLYEKYAKNINKKRFETTIKTHLIENLKHVKFYDSLEKIIKTGEDIHYLDRYSAFSFSFFLYNKEKIFYNSYKKKQYNHIKSIIKYLKKLKINWELASYCAYDIDNYEEKYNLLNYPKRVKINSGQYIYPRMDFVRIYKAIVQSCSVDELKTLLPYIDNLISLKNVDIKLFDRKLFPSERKKIIGKSLEHTEDKNDKEMISLMFKHLNFNQIIPLKESQYEISSEMVIVNKIYELFKEYLNKEDFIKSIPKNMDFSILFFKICKFYDLDDKADKYKEALKKFNINGNVERLILDRISNDFKTESVDNIFTDGIGQSYYNDKFSISFSINMEYLVDDLKKEIELGKIVGITKNTVAEKAIEVKHYIKKTYFPTYNEMFIKRKIEDINDALLLFDRYVVKPICAYKSGFYRTSSFGLDEHDNNILKELFKIFLCGSQNVLNIMRMSHNVHKYRDSFIKPCNNPTSLNPNDDNVSSMFNSEKDSVRESFGLSSHYEWIPGINGIFETCLNDEKYVIIPLINNEELSHEGKVMRHCVGWGAYSDSSLRGISKIFSVRKKNNDDIFERVSTLELSFDVSKKEVSIRQNKGFRNSVLTDADNISKKLVDVINLKKDNIVMWDNIKNEQETELDHLYDRNIANDAGYLPNDIKLIEEAIKPWLPYLDKKYHNIESFFELNFIKKRINMIIEREK